MAKDAGMRQFAEAALNTRMDAELSRKAAESAVTAASLLLERASVDSLWS